MASFEKNMQMLLMAYGMEDGMKPLFDSIIGKDVLAPNEGHLIT